jgi:hypothetical protein
VVAGLSVVALLAYGPYTLRGSFYSDDWNFAADYEAESADGFFAGVGNLLEISVSRPVGTVYAAARSELFGLDPTGHLVLAAALGAVANACGKSEAPRRACRSVALPKRSPDGSRFAR